MRYWLVILMILFTPLRGVAGDMMAIGMAAQKGSAAHYAVAPAPAVAAAMPHADCVEHAVSLGNPTTAAIPAAGEPSTAVAESSCPACASCMVCSTAALALQTNMPAAVALHHMQPGPGITSFHSAPALPGFKPPIS